uniref:rab GTPase-activating protein 1-like n=1 Tax=Ciona intestinalis TaxID=7719 RepID=UPI000180C68C|nr:rab GTPase-activating protein 1-like [Ciona intestinalis]XP_026691883.1 rab GTPase-activating protein 1-like [Ciona intestinalis]|eukprot:XP_002131287.1 rab GTPase-activating protein 1-like [Ciona intestinalis]
MDKLSLNSAASSDNISSEFEVVLSQTCHSDNSNIETGLKIAGNGNEDQLKQTLEEVMISSDIINSDLKAQEEQDTSHNETRPTTLGVETATVPSKDKLSLEDEDCILFNGVYYLGCASVNAPRSEMEALRTISILRAQQDPESSYFREFNLPGQNDTDDNPLHKQIEVVLSVPNRADGTVRLLEPGVSGVMTSFKLYTILFCCRGADDSAEKDCFAFTESHQSSGIFQCHVFRCEVHEAVRKVLYSFELAFRSIPKSPVNTDAKLSAGAQLLRRSQIQEGLVSVSPGEASMNTLSHEVDENTFCFTVTLEIKEDDTKGGYATVPWDKTSSCFKLRHNLMKQVIVKVTQTSNVELTLERCFGLLLTPGRNVKHSDMHLLDMNHSPVEDEPLTGTRTVVGLWDPSHTHFALLNTETQKGTRVFLSVAVDLVVQEIQEPVRFLIETKARIFPQNEKFWYFGKKILHEQFFLKLKELATKKVNKPMYEVECIESETWRSKWSSSTEQHPPLDRALCSSSPQDEEDDDDTDEPLLSGSGEVSKECTERVLHDWGDALARWRADLSRRPTGLRTLIRAGIPDALRGEVWQLLAGCHDNQRMLEKYRVLITKDSPQENIIQRDIHRTFPANDYFKTTGGSGQDSLYRITKAYSVFDHEVGYCQGLSFLAAALLLHMPEEQAFCVLIKIMYDNKMRDLFKNGFETLHLKFYQLDRCIEELMPNLHDHFKQLGIECHMFSSQWFLTLFTAKFPLSMVYQVVDVFLSEGEPVVFRVALGLLHCSRMELLALDFEGVLKYFRVQLPKKYRNEEHTKLLIQTAVNLKLKKMKKYEKDYQLEKERLALEEDPLIRIEKENKRLMEGNLRLELENDDLARELVTNRVTLGTQLEKTMEHADNLQCDLSAAIEDLRTNRNKVCELNDENQRLVVEAAQVKEMCRKEMDRQATEIEAKSKIVADYKTICSQLSLRIENMQIIHKEEVEAVKMNKENVPSTKLTQSDKDQQHKNEKEKLEKQIRELELQLAQTKLKLVESECRVQDVEHQLASSTKELQASKNTWFQKTLSTLTTRKTDSSNIPSPTATSGASFAAENINVPKRQTVP